MSNCWQQDGVLRQSGWVYQVMIFNEQGDYYIMLGQAREDVEKNVAAFKKMASTFKRK